MGRPRIHLIQIPEREILKTAVAMLTAWGWTVHRRNVGAMTIAPDFGPKRIFRANTPGMSDLWGTCPDGRHFELELKRAGKVPTAIQSEWLLRMNARPNTVAFWVDNTATLERVARHIMAGGSVEYDFEQGMDYDLTFETQPRSRR